MGFLFLSSRVYRSLSCLMIAFILALALTAPLCTAQAYVEPYAIQVLPSGTQVYLSDSVRVEVVVTDSLGNPVSGAMVVLEDSSSGSYYQWGGNQYTNDRGVVTYMLAYSLASDVGTRTLRATCYYGSQNIGAGSATFEVLNTGSAGGSGVSGLAVVVGALMGSGLLIILLIVLVVCALVVVRLLLRKKPGAEAIELTPGADAIQADGASSVNISIRFKDAGGYAVSKADRTLTLQTTLGRIESPVKVPARASSGNAVLRAGTTDGVAEITASSGPAKGQCRVTFKGLPTRYCMHCGSPLAASASQCPRCGLTPPSGQDVRSCINCGTIIPELAKFCHKCGACQPGPK